MKKFVNEVDNILSESLIGFGKAHSDIINVNLSPDFVSRKNKPNKDKVSLISGLRDVSMVFRYTHLKAEDILSRV